MSISILRHRAGVKSRQQWLRASVVLLGVLLVSAPLYAQVGANVGGLITDGSGGVLPGVTITVTNTATGVAQALVTSDQGRYRAVALQPGPYQITAELQGFGTVRREIVLAVGADATVDITLGVATVAETVTVLGEAPLIEVAKSQPSTVITGDQLESLPVLSRNYLVLAQLMPGTGPARVGSLFAVTKFGGVADQRWGYITVIDGGDLHDPVWGHATINLSQDAVSEFKVFRNQFDSEYGSALAAIVSVVTKAGTNQMRGSGFYFDRDDSLNARNAFARTTPPYSQVRAGASFGGPLALNRTHYFLSYEQQRRESAEITALPPTNPFAALENGIYPNLRTDKNGLVKVDHRFNDRHDVSARYLFGDWLLDEGARPVRVLNGIELGPLREIQKGRAHSALAEEKWILSDSKLNSLRFHVLNNMLEGQPHSFLVRTVRPSFSWGQFHRDPQYIPQRKYSLYETFFATAGAHDLKFGGEFTWENNAFDAHHLENGNWTFTTDAPFEANNPATWPFSFEQRQPGLYKHHMTIFAGFVQDTWRLGNVVNLNLGLRYDFETNLRDNDTYKQVATIPKYAWINNFIDVNRGAEWDNFQPRLGATWDIRGNGTLVGRAGWGYYIARQQPWLMLNSRAQVLGTSVLITDPQRLRFYPDINAVLGGNSLVELSDLGGGALSPEIYGDRHGRIRQYTTTAGVSWQLTSTTSFDADYVQSHGTRQRTTVDRNLPEWGPISPSNPRPYPAFASIRVVEGITTSSYEALEMQVRQRVRGGNSLLVSYTLGRALVDLSNGTLRSTFFNNKGYNADDTRHNLTVSASTELPFGFQLSGIGRFISGYPKAANSGLDLDGDRVSGDRPPGLPVTVGRGNVDEELRIINEFRAARGLAPFTKDVLDLFPSKTIDMRATKSIQLGASRRVEVFFEAFNVTNWVNKGGAASNIRLATFGVPTTAGDARQAQWGARFSF